MHFKKIFILIALSMAIGFFGCAKEKAEAPTKERITKNLVPPKAEVKGENFLIELRDLQVTTIEDITSKEIVETPKLTGHIVIIPRKAIKEKALGKIEISLVYIPSPLNRETIVFPEKIE